MKPLFLLHAFLLLGIPGCATKTVHQPFSPPAPGMINHVVFFDLQDPEDAGELIADCYDLLQKTESSSGYAGRHYDIGRPGVLNDYDVGFFVAFQSEEAYRTYVEHPEHVSLVEKWKSRWDSIRVYDVGDARLLNDKGNQ